jgi:SAM-dependent methyltransferase
LPLLFAVTLFLSAFLLFLIQPMIGKILLPYLGGTPAVWNTCMVFFQAALLAGYLYAHAITRRFGVRRQLGLHLLLLLLPLAPLAFLRLDVGRLARDWLPPPTEANPIGWLLLMLALSTGLPFFVVSTSAPLLQKWYAATGARGASDPYFLYGASNLGSMLALLGYPFLIQPNIGLAVQAWIWIAGYGVLLALTALCGLLARRAVPPGEMTTAVPDGGRADIRVLDPQDRVEAVPPLRWLRWVALAFVPSSLMLGLTTYVTTDLAPIPLLWTIPLALYLLSFILVFSRLPGIVHVAMVLLLPVAILFVLAPNQMAATVVDLPGMGGLPEALHIRAVQLSGGGFKVWLGLQHIIVIHLAALFVAAMVCHGELARTRPTVRNLTGFYVCLSLGGVLGGLFNALLAPLLFNRVVEYPMMIAGACLLLPSLGLKSQALWAQTANLLVTGTVGVFGLLAAGFILASTSDEAHEFAMYQVVSRLPWDWQRPAHDIFQTNRVDSNDLISEQRTFFGVLRVTSDDWSRAKYHYLVHGNIWHSMQCHDPPEGRSEPLAYFHRDGPIGDLFRVVEARQSRPRIAVLGMGAGTLAAYAQRDWDVTFYEIDKEVIKLAHDPAYFTYLEDAKRRGAHINEVLGDGRLQIQKAPDGSFDLIFMDAFSSDSVPTHLLTREALTMYRTKLAPGGIIIVNIANRYLDFEPVMGNLADELGMCCLIGTDKGVSYTRFATAWVLLARSEEDFGALASMEGVQDVPPVSVKLTVMDFNVGLDTTLVQSWPRWRKLERDPRVGVWTDDYTDIFRVFRW